MDRTGLGGAVGSHAESWGPGLPTERKFAPFIPSCEVCPKLNQLVSPESLAAEEAETVRSCGDSSQGLVALPTGVKNGATLPCPHPGAPPLAPSFLCPPPRWHSGPSASQSCPLEAPAQPL